MNTSPIFISIRIFLGPNYAEIRYKCKDLLDTKFIVLIFTGCCKLSRGAKKRGESRLLMNHTIIPRV